MIEAKGHAWNKGEVTKEATCSAKGEMLYTCTTCEETKTEEIDIDPDNHVALDTTIALIAANISTATSWRSPLKIR